MVKPSWIYRSVEKISSRSLHIEVIADYGGGHFNDHAFSEVRNHFLRFDKKSLIGMVTEHPVCAFSTLETGFWIAQEALHSEHPNLIIFSNTAPRGDIAWQGEKEQPFVCMVLTNGIPVFAVHAGYNLSFIKDRIESMWEVNVPNTGTQFRSRDQYPEATMAILNGDMTQIGEKVDLRSIPDIPSFHVASIDGYGNLKTTIKRGDLAETIKKSSVLRVIINNYSQLVLNTLSDGIREKAGDLCMVVGSSGGKKGPYIEFVRLMSRAADDFNIEDVQDNLSPIKIEPVSI